MRRGFPELRHHRIAGDLRFGYRKSFEIGAKNNIANRIRLATSVYYVRWNNIQQTVVPPICSDLLHRQSRTAVAKGADIQADILVTNALTAEISAGYTDARYTQDSKFSATQTTPIVSSGDAISGQSGQPNPPATASMGLEYTSGRLGTSPSPGSTTSTRVAASGYRPSRLEHAAVRRG